MNECNQSLRLRCYNKISVFLLLTFLYHMDFAIYFTDKVFFVSHNSLLHATAKSFASIQNIWYKNKNKILTNFFLYSTIHRHSSKTWLILVTKQRKLPMIKFIVKMYVKDVTNTRHCVKFAKAILNAELINSKICKKNGEKERQLY